MKKLIFILLLSALCGPAFGQSSCRQSVFAAPEYGTYVSKNDKSEVWKPGFSAGYGIDYYVSKADFIAIGLSLEYLYTNGICYKRGFYNDNGYKIQLQQHSINLPVNLKIGFRENKNLFTYFQASIGISYAFYIHSKVMENNKVVASDNNSGDLMGAYYELGIGQNFAIKNRLFYASFIYLRDIKSNTRADDVVGTDDASRRYFPYKSSFELRLGFFLRKIERQ